MSAKSTRHAAGKHLSVQKHNRFFQFIKTILIACRLSPLCSLYNPLKAVGVRSRSLPELLSLSGKGVPSIGAVECLRTLLFKYSHLYTREELEGLARRARRKNRVLAAELLEDAALRDDDVADVEYPHRGLNELPTECIEARTACA